MFSTLLNHAFTLSAADSKRNIPFPVQVPAGTTQLTIRFSFSPAEVDGFKNMLTLSLFDPSGFRGAGHRHGTTHEVTLSTHHATPGFIAGPLSPGTWTVVIDTHMIMSGAPCEAQLTVSASAQPLDISPIVHKAGRTPSRGRGWYRGDLHAHTLHSDASWDVPDLLAWARANKLDFVTLTDHNTTSPLAQMDAAKADDLLTMGGMELTTFWGHALALGLRDWVDWRTHDDGRSIEQIAAEVTERNGLFVIAHPMSQGDPYCTGCRWVYPTMRPGIAHVVEAWNHNWNDENEAGLELIYQWLNAGHRLALTAGTDIHGAPKGEHYGFNVVYAADLSEREILRAVRAGHLYISAGPRLEMSASTSAQQVLMGDVFHHSPGDAVPVAIRWDHCPAGSKLRMIANGKTRIALSVGSSGERAWNLDDGKTRWCLFTLSDPTERLLALTNPIYIES